VTVAHELLPPPNSESGTDVVAHARRAAAQVAQSSGHPDLEFDIRLVVSELVTNAMLHGGGCTGAHVFASDDGLRVEIADASPVPPVLGHASDSSLTGRGMRLVARLSRCWGAEPTDGGKVIWAELSEGPAVPDASAAGLLDEWAESWQEPGSGGRVRVELGDVPTRLLLEAKSHVDNLVRESALSSDDSPAPAADGSGRLQELLLVVDGFDEARVSIKHQALAAHERGDTTTHLVLSLPIDSSQAAEAYLAALDELDSYCRAGRLLTLPTPPQHRLFRQWYVGELIEQLRAHENGSGGLLPPTTFLERLLDEVDRMDAARRAAQRTSRLYAMASAMATAATPEAVAEAVLVEGVAALGANAGGVLLSSSEDQLRLPGAVGYEPNVIEQLRSESPDATLPAAHALRTGDPVWIESRAERDRRFPELVGLERKTISMCAVPLEVQGRRLGAVRFSFGEEHLFDDDERQFVLTLAALAAQAFDRAELQRQQLEPSR
jgi:hypothetical protein